MRRPPPRAWRTRSRERSVDGWCGCGVLKRGYGEIWPDLSRSDPDHLRRTNARWPKTATAAACAMKPCCCARPTAAKSWLRRPASRPRQLGCQPRLRRGERPRAVLGQQATFGRWSAGWRWWSNFPTSLVKYIGQRLVQRHWRSWVCDRNGRLVSAEYARSWPHPRASSPCLAQTRRVSR